MRTEKEIINQIEYERMNLEIDLDAGKAKSAILRKSRITMLKWVLE